MVADMQLNAQIVSLKQIAFQTATAAISFGILAPRHHMLLLTGCNNAHTVAEWQ